jgi:peptidoglycan/xylan/chitin deacetylase (PgdA/CDA1 family)
MTLRSIWAAATASLLSLAACQSVHTQDAASTPSLDKPVSMTLGAAATPGSSPAPSPSASPAAKKPAPRTYSQVPGVGRTVALTFDDGPSAKLTPMLLDILKQRGIKATFFLVGQNAAEYPDIVKREIAEGHEVGNHSWSHPQLTKLSADGVTAQIEKTNAAIRAAIGHDPVVMRPPYGATNARLDRRLNDQYGMKVILWDVDPLDWKYHNSARVEREILSQTKPGSIILVHDIHATSVAAMPDTLDALIAKGYKFVTVSELIAMAGSVAPTTPAPTAKPEVAATPEIKQPSATITPPSAPTGTPFTVQPYESASPAPTPGAPAMDGSATQ